MLDEPGPRPDPGRPPDGPEIAVEALGAVTDADAAGVARLVPQLSSAPAPTREELVEIVASPATTLLVARAGREVVGMLTLLVFRIPTGIRCLVEDVVVDDGRRGEGIGAALVAAAVEAARSAGARDVDLTSRPSRAAANRLYARSGFARRETNVWRLRLD